MDNINPEVNHEQEQHIYTESWMNNQSGIPYNPLQNMGQIFGQPAQNPNPYSTIQNGPNPYFPQKQKGVGFSIAGMICGILSIISCFLIVFDFIIALPGLILSIIALANKCEGKGMAVAGVVCSACGIVLSITFMVFCLSL